MQCVIDVTLLHFVHEWLAACVFPLIKVLDLKDKSYVCTLDVHSGDTDPCKERKCNTFRNDRESVSIIFRSLSMNYIYMGALCELLNESDKLQWF